MAHQLKQEEVRCQGVMVIFLFVLGFAASVPLTVGKFHTCRGAASAQYICTQVLCSVTTLMRNSTPLRLLRPPVAYTVSRIIAKWVKENSGQERISTVPENPDMRDVPKRPTRLWSPVFQGARLTKDCERHQPVT